jgi:hypothetical protein
MTLDVGKARNLTATTILPLIFQTDEKYYFSGTERS